MRLNALLITVSCLFLAGFVLADDDVMITRDGSMMIGKNEVLSLTTSSPDDSTILKASNSADNKQKLLASATAGSDLAPALGMNAAEIEMKVNAINPYTLYRKGSVAEYKFQQNGKDFAYMGGPTYIQQVVSDERIENGLLVSYVSQRFFNKKHQPSKGVPAKYLGYLFPTEIDVNGNFHLTHDISEDCGYYIKKRQGYAMLIPGHMEVGQRLPCSSINDMLSGTFGGNWKCIRTYKDFVVEKEEQAITPAGTFDCMKLVGKMEVKGELGEYTVRYDLWLARGIGVVRLDVTTILKDGTDGRKYTIYLNALTLT